MSKLLINLEKRFGKTFIIGWLVLQLMIIFYSKKGCWLKNNIPSLGLVIRYFKLKEVFKTWDEEILVTESL